MNNIRMFIIIKIFVNQIKILFRFKANRWLSEEKDDQKTYIDLLPEGQKTPPASPLLIKGT